MAAVKIQYISHSGFFVETDTRCFLFDYSGGILPENISKPLVIFVSHSHGDHFSHDIFRYGEQFENTVYVLSSDIKINNWLKRRCDITDDMLPRIISIAPDEETQVGGAKIRTLKSTDIGVAFLIDVDGKTIYHAGDLHWWLWDGEDTPESAAAMTAAFRHEIAKIAGTHIDIAFLTLDPRQTEEEFYLGMDHCARNLDIDHIIPMHCWSKYDVIDRMKAHPCAASYADKIVKINTEGDTYEF